VFSYTIHARTDTWPSRSPLALSIFFPLLLRRFPSSVILRPLYVTGAHLSQDPGSSGSIVSGYELDDRAIEVRSPPEAKDFSSRFCVQTGSGAHPASCTMGTGSPFRRAKARPEREADHSTPSSAEV
jgi:hypothetical protein